MKTAVLLVALASLAAFPRVADATGFTDVEADDLGPRDHDFVTVDGALRLRGDLFYNLDLDRGLDPSGQPLFPVSSAHPKSQTFSAADTRLRTDVSAYAPQGSFALKARIDLLDDLALGGTEPGVAPSRVTATGRDAVLRVKRVYAEALTPVGLITAGRMGSTWGLGLLANGGDDPDASYGDAADRVAFVTPVVGLIWAAAYDFDSIDWTAPRDAYDQVNLGGPAAQRTVTFAVLRWRDPTARNRRLAAGKTTLEYGAVVSRRWQSRDVPGAYGAAGTTSSSSTASRSIPRGFQADALDGWVRVSGPWGRVEAEGAYLSAIVRQASTIPGILLHQPIRSTQSGAALESEFGTSAFSAGLDLGYASGDPQYGMGANPTPGATAARPGDLDGPQAVLPGDARVDNFRFHPEYRIDRILFHELIGTVTDAIYVRPHARARLVRTARGTLVASLAVIDSRAIYASSTPGQKTPLGVEIDPTLAFVAHDGLSAALEHAVLFPLAGLDNPDAGLTAKPAQSIRLRLLYRF